MNTIKNLGLPDESLTFDHGRAEWVADLAELQAAALGALEEAQPIQELFLVEPIARR